MNSQFKMDTSYFALRNLGSVAIVWVLLIFTLPPICAQQAPEPKETPPPGPLIQKRADDFSCWTITQKLAAATASPSPASASGKKDSDGSLQTTSFVKTGDVLRAIIVDSQHRTWNIWVKNGMQVVIWPDQKSVGVVTKPGSSSDINPFYVDLSASDFPVFQWISADNYAGIRTVLGKRCLIFKDKVKALPKGEKDNGIVSESVAAVDYDTRLPVSLSNGYGMFLYTFLAAPKDMQTLPESVQTYIDNERRKAQALTRLPGSPY
jgi:hypothetical protein